MPEIPSRTLWYVDPQILNKGTAMRDGRVRADEKTANLISSLLEDGRHAPAIDLDIPIRLIPSSTKGHHHLYIDKALTWREYRILLRALHKIGLIESGCYWRGIHRGGTFLRRPGVKKLGNPERNLRTLLAWLAVRAESLLKLIKWNITELISR